MSACARTPSAPAAPAPLDALPAPSWNPRYGEKLVKGSPCPRSYYKCSQPGCPAKKIVERDADSGDVLSTQYKARRGRAGWPARGRRGQSA